MHPSQHPDKLIPSIQLRTDNLYARKHRQDWAYKFMVEVNDELNLIRQDYFNKFGSLKSIQERLLTLNRKLIRKEGSHFTYVSGRSAQRQANRMHAHAR